MRLLYILISFIAFSLCVMAQDVSPGIIPRSISESGQFVVFASDPEVRMAVAQLAEEIRKHWRRVSGVDNQWKYPIVILFSETPSPRQADPVQIKAYQADAGAVKFQITIRDVRAIDSNLLLELLFQSLLLEWSSRTNPPKIGQRYELPPLWLRKALLQDFLVYKGQAPDPMANNVFKVKKEPSILEVISQERIPATQVEERLFRLKSYALLRTILDTSRGRQVLCEIASKTRSNKQDVQAILQAIPDYGKDPQAFEKRWLSMLTRVSHQDESHFLTMRETQDELDQILAIEVKVQDRLKKASTIQGPKALSALARNKGGSDQLLQIANRLLRLETRANPVYQPAIAKYRDITSTLIRNTRADISKRLAEADTQVASLKKQSKEIANHLNWFEVNKAETSDAEFEHFVNAMPSLQDFHPRNDAISRCLDEFSNKIP